MSSTDSGAAERFYVGTVEGYRTPQRRGSSTPHLSVHVIDRKDCRRVVATFISENVRGRGSAIDYQRAQAVHLAELEASRLNRIYLHSEREPDRRQ